MMPVYKSRHHGIPYSKNIHVVSKNLSLKSKRENFLELDQPPPTSIGIFTFQLKLIFSTFLIFTKVFDLIMSVAAAYFKLTNVVH